MDDPYAECDHGSPRAICPVCSPKRKPKRAGYRNSGDLTLVRSRDGAREQSMANHPSNRGFRRGKKSMSTVIPLRKRAEFESTCVVCDDDILEGDSITCDEGDWVHEGCANGN